MMMKKSQTKANPKRRRIKLKGKRPRMGQL